MTEMIYFPVLAYLAGSIPFGLLYSKLIEQEDIRETGSGNIGATNIIRGYGWTPGILVLLLDASKGAIPAYLSKTLFPASPTVWMLVGAAAIIGHIYPIFLGFSGGKGVATSCGVFLVLTTTETGIALIVFLIFVGLTRYMSVGSLTGALTLPVATSYFRGLNHPLTIGAILLACMVYWRHRGNIKRLLRGEENKFF